MKKTFFAGLLLMAALQSANAQKIVLHKTDGQTIECSVSELDSITFEDDGFIVVDEHEWVDLSLPSGTLWATCNVGANSPEEYGDYFAWGETKPKKNYSWNTYTLCNGEYNTLTKYCTNNNWGSDGFVDNITELEPEDDVATANWGNGWQMPSNEQIEELCTNTTVIWTTQDGANGILFTSKNNNNNIFLPAAGWQDEKSTNDGKGSSVHLWSRTLYTFYPVEACRCYFTGFDNRLYIDSGSRYIGRSVRPVRIKTR